MENKTKSDKSLQAEEQKRVAAGFSLRKSAEEHLRKSKAKHVDTHG